MPAVTIGVPVYNSADLLDGSLACLARQTFRDFKVLMIDDGSTDGASDVAKGWAARDPRFEYRRQPHRVGGLANMRDCLLAADTQWFMWRADDDLSDDNYLEALYALATESPGCKLAVSTAVLADWDLRPLRVSEPPVGLDPASTRDRIRALLASGPPWYYGLWDRETLRAAYLGVLDNFSYPFGSDYLTVYGPAIDGVVRTTTATRIVMRIRRAPKAGEPRGRTRFAVMWEIRRGFIRNLSRIRAERDLPPTLRIALLAVQPYYLRRVLPSLTKMLRRGVRELFGLAGPPGTSWHVQRHG
jgi:glycosyltransferase involved in cell wall biosynthesis